MDNSSRPNIVYILADDLGYGDVSCLNERSKIQTPHMDQAAREGMTFTDAHSNSAVCTPTRYGILTGRYCWRSRLKQGVLHGYSRELIEHDRMTVAHLLQQSGYRTACIGKWHLGLGWRLENGEYADVAHDGIPNPGVDFSCPPEHGPHTVGFDYSLIMPASLDMPPYCYLENGRLIDLPTETCQDSPRPAFWRGGDIAPGIEHETCLLEFTRRAEAFIAGHAQSESERPFFLYLPLPSPHTPHVPREPFQGKSQCGVYGDFVMEHDWSIGQVLQALDRNGMRENTLVIITSDNGAHMRGPGFDFEAEYDHRSNHIFRGQKSDSWDGGHRVPFIVRWPARLPAGRVCDQLVCLTDFFATCADLLGLDLADDSAEDSMSMLPLLTGNTAARTREWLITSSFYGLDAIRHRNWKLVECAGSGGWSAVERHVSPGAPPQQLYDRACPRLRERGGQRDSG